MFDETPFFHVMIWSHPSETTIWKLVVKSSGCSKYWLVCTRSSHFRAIQKAYNRGKYKQYRNECLTSDLHTPWRYPKPFTNNLRRMDFWIVYLFGGIFQWYLFDKTQCKNALHICHKSTNNLKNEQLAVQKMLIIGKQLYFVSEIA